MLYIIFNLIFKWNFFTSIPLEAETFHQMQQIITNRPVFCQGSCQEPDGGGDSNPCGRRFLVFEGFVEQDDGRNWYKRFPMGGNGLKVYDFLEITVIFLNTFLKCFISVFLFGEERTLNLF